MEITYHPIWEYFIETVRHGSCSVTRNNLTRLLKWQRVKPVQLGKKSLQRLDLLAVSTQLFYYSDLFRGGGNQKMHPALKWWRNRNLWARICAETVWPLFIITYHTTVPRSIQKSTSPIVTIATVSSSDLLLRSLALFSALVRNLARDYFNSRVSFSIIY